MHQHKANHVHMVPTLPTYGIHMVCTWYGYLCSTRGHHNILNMVYIRSYGKQMVYTWYIVHIWYTHGIRMVYIWNTHGIHICLTSIYTHSTIYPPSLAPHSPLHCPRGPHPSLENCSEAEDMVQMAFFARRNA